MALKRERIDDLAEKALQYADDKWDKALLGYVEDHSGTIMPCYGYQALKVLSKKYNSDYASAFSAVNNLASEGHFILHRLNERVLWETIKAHNTPRWASLDKAILGLGKSGWTDAGVVYNRALCINIFSSMQAVSSGSAMDNYTQAINFIDNCIIPVAIGDPSPWYLTSVI